MLEKIRVNKKIIFIFILIILFIFISFKEMNIRLQKKDSSLKNNEEVFVPINKINILEEKKKWSELIGRIGGDKAYAKFKEVFSFEVNGNQHSVAHLFGELLYDKLGVSSLKVCDETFGFGCYHGVFTSAIGDKGPSILKDLDKICIEKSGTGGSGCQHGLGHGLVEYYGHTIEGLNKALISCNQTTVFAKKFGCTSGAFMEFNIPNSISNIDKKEFYPKDPYYPCPLVPSKFQESCHYELAQYWQNVLERDYTKMGILCSSIKDQVNRESCYLGIGHIVVESLQMNIKNAEDVCNKMPDQDGRLLCMAGITWEVFGNKDTRPKAKEACKTLPANLFNKCLIKADFVKHNGEIFNNL